MIQKKIDFILLHWKLGIHLLLRTKYFGVNNRWFSASPSLWGWSLSKRIISILLIYPILQNAYAMRVRMSQGVGWVSAEVYENTFGEKLLYQKGVKHGG